MDGRILVISCVAAVSSFASPVTAQALHVISGGRTPLMLGARLPSTPMRQPKVVLAGPHLSLDRLYPARQLGTGAIVFREGRATIMDHGRTHRTHFELGPSAALFTIDATRVRFPGAAMATSAGMPANRSAIWTIDAGYQLQTGQDDTVRVGAALIADKRKPPIAIADGHGVRSTTRSVELQWRHKQSVAVELGWFATGASHGLSTIERDVARAAGSPISEHGYNASILLLLAPSRPQTGPALRLNFANASLDPSDALSFGTAKFTDRRAAVFLEMHF